MVNLLDGVMHGLADEHDSIDDDWVSRLLLLVSDISIEEHEKMKKAMLLLLVVKLELIIRIITIIP